jgi:hypothetical protein
MVFRNEDFENMNFEKKINKKKLKYSGVQIINNEYHIVDKGIFNTIEFDEHKDDEISKFEKRPLTPESLRREPVSILIFFDFTRDEKR